MCCDGVIGRVFVDPVVLCPVVEEDLAGDDTVRLPEVVELCGRGEEVNNRHVKC